MDGLTLGAACQKIGEPFFSEIEWGDIWKRNLSTGSAFEWLCLFGIAHSLTNAGWRVYSPTLDLGGNKLFCLRNEIPTSFGSQAGNSGMLQAKCSKADRFFFCLVPKFTAVKEGRSISLFREGCPYHKIMCKDKYHDRPDIVILDGSLNEGFPKLNSMESEVSYSYNFNDTTLEGILRIVNSDLVPIKKREPRSATVQPLEIIECSVNKSKEIAVLQLEKYIDLFYLDQTNPSVHLITGNELSDLCFSRSVVNIESVDVDKILEEVLQAGNKIVAQLASQI